MGGVLLVVVAGGAGRAACAAEPAATQAGTGVRAEGRRWEALPAGVCSVFLGPDQRRWFVKKPGDGAIDLDAIKKQVAAEWRKPAPLLIDCWPAMFEKSGAVWLVTRDCRLLLRYDGEHWVDHEAHNPPEVPGGFVGVCPGHGLSGNREHNLEVGGVRFFIESTGISAYDGKECAFQPFVTGGSKSYTDPVALLPEKGGKSVLVLQSRPTTYLWRYRAGQWSQVDFPWKGYVSGAAVGPDGSLWANLNEKVVTIPLEGGKGGEDAPAKGDLARAEPSPLKIKDWDVNQYHPSLWQDQTGDIHVGLSMLPVEICKEQRGVLLVKPDGNMKFLPGIATPTKPIVHRSSVSGVGDESWWYTTTVVGPAQMWRANLAVDPPTQEKMGVIGFQFVQEVADDGTVFVSAGDPLNSSWRMPQTDGINAIIGYKPAAPDDRPMLQPKTLEVGGSLAVASDGAMWAPIPDQGLCRYDGMAWRPMVGATVPAGILIPGHEGTMLQWYRFRMEVPESFALIDAGKRLEGQDLMALIRDNRQAFVKACGGLMEPAVWDVTQERFGGVSKTTGQPVMGGWSVAVDKGGRVWMVIDHKLRVLDATRTWTELQWPAGADPQPNLPNQMERGPTTVVRVGDGVYVADMTLAKGLKHSSGGVPARAYFVTLQDGKANWADALEVPAANDQMFRAPDGALWIAFRRETQGKPPWTNVKNVLARVDGNADPKEYVLPAEPVLLDRSGILWLAAGGSYVDIHDGAFSLWKDGEIVGHVSVPGVWTGKSIVADKPGSVWVLTNIGLHHLVAEGASKPFDYQVKTFGIVTDPTGDVFNSTLAVCDQGLVLGTYYNGEDHLTHHRLHLIPTAAK